MDVYILLPTVSPNFVRIRVGGEGGGCVADVVDAVALYFGLKSYHISLGLIAPGGTRPSVAEVAEATARAEAAPLDISLGLGGAAEFGKGAWLVAVQTSLAPPNSGDLGTSLLENLSLLDLDPTAP